MAKLIEEGSEVKVQIVDPDQVSELCGGTFDYLSKDKKARVVTLVDPQKAKNGACPCSGTHVRDLKEIG